MPKKFLNSINMVDYTAKNEPVAPASGVELWNRLRSRRLLALKAPTGVSSVLQPHIAEKSISIWEGIANSASFSSFGFPAPTVLGTLTAVGVTTTNILTAMRRVQVVSAAAAGSLAEIRANAAQVHRGAGTPLGGFYLACKFGFSAVPAGRRWFLGLIPNAAATNVDPSTLINMCGVGQDTADTQIQFMYNDGSGTATKSVGTSGQSTPTTSKAYLFTMFCAPSGSDIVMGLEDLGTANYTEHSTAGGGAPTNIPVTTTLLTAKFWACNNATASAVSFDVGSLYLETDY
jgi:hypothetical protein